MFIDTLLAGAGLFVGRHPKAAVLTSVAFFLLSAILLGITKKQYQLDFEQGYTTPDAPSIREIREQINFFGKEGAKPWYMALFAESRNGSMTNDKEFNEFRDFYEESMNWTIAQRGDLNLTFKNFCSPTCGLNDVLFKTFVKSLTSLRNLYQDMAVFGLSWPITSIFGYKSNIGKYFFKREFNKYGNLKRANTTVLYYMVFVDNPEKAKALENYELLITKKIAEHNANKNFTVDFVSHGVAGVGREVKRGMALVVPLVITGLVLIIVLALVSLLSSTLILSRLNASFAIVALAGIFTPILAIVAAFAAHVLLCHHLNVLHFLSPLFTFGIGKEHHLITCSAFDGILYFYNAWLRQEELSVREGRDQAERASHAFLNSAGGVLIIAVASAGTFMFGFFTPIPELSNLSVMLLFSSIFSFLFLLFFFVPMLVLFSHGPPGVLVPDTDNPKTHKLEPEVHTCDCYHSFFDSYSATIANTVVRLLVLAFFLVMSVAPAVFGCTQAKGNLDYRQLLPPDSPNIKGVEYMSDYVWPEFLQILYIIQKPPNFAESAEYAQFFKMINELETMSNTIGKETNMAWINDYRNFPGVPPADGQLNMSRFKDFITDKIFGSWRSGVRATFTNVTQSPPLTKTPLTGQLFNNGEILEKVSIDKMLYIISYNGTWTMAQKGDLIRRCREIVARYPQFQTTPFDNEVGMIDVIHQTPVITIHILLVMVALVFGVFLILVANGVTAVVAALAAASIMSTTLGLVTLWGVYLNPFTIGVYLLSSAASLRFTVHVCYHFVRAALPKEAGKAARLRYALENSCLSTLESALVGGILLVPLLLAPVNIFFELGKIALVVLVTGLLHGLVFVPCLLVTLPKALLRRMC